MAVPQNLLRMFFRLARGFFPVIQYKGNVFVFRHSDVVEVLRRDQDFTIEPINGENIGRHIGPFMLGMDASPRLEHEHRAMYAVIDRADQGRIRNFVRGMARDCLAVAREKGSFDLVRDYTRLVPLRMVADYFGVAGPSEDEMLRWNRLIFWDIFLNFEQDAGLREEALAASSALNTHLDTLVQGRKAALNRGSHLPDDLVSRLLTAQQGQGPALDDDGIRRNIAGALLGAEEPISKVCIHAMEVLLTHPKALAAAKKAAASEDVERVGRLVFDALRYNPSNPVMLRYCPQEQRIGREGGKKRRIRAGKTIYAVTLSANFDPKAFPRPKHIQDDRPHDPYLHFGYGQHVCYGNQVNYVAIPEMMTALLQQRIHSSGTLTKEGTFPDCWEWEFEA